MSNDQDGVKEEMRRQVESVKHRLTMYDNFKRALETIADEGHPLAKIVLNVDRALKEKQNPEITEEQYNLNDPEWERIESLSSEELEAERKEAGIDDDSGMERIRRIIKNALDKWKEKQNDKT